MHNEYVEMYCSEHNLKITVSECKFYDKIILENNKIIATFLESGKYINFTYRKKEYKKSDLLQFIIENQKAH